LLARAAYVGNSITVDKRFDISAEGLGLFITPLGIKSFYAFRKIKMCNKKKLKYEQNNSYKKIFRFEDSTHRNLAAAKDELPQILRDQYTSKYGELSATDCAIKVGYDRDSAHTGVSELLNLQRNPEIVRQIENRKIGNKEVIIQKTIILKK
jgi:hypothetical protein